MVTIQCIWHAIVVSEGEYEDPSKETWGLAFMKRAGASGIGRPFSFGHRVLDSKIGDEYWGEVTSAITATPLC